jgi:hypothetical protein
LTFILRVGPGSVPFPNPVFETQPLTITELLVVLGLSSSVFIVAEIEKYPRRRNRLQE